MGRANRAKHERRTVHIATAPEPMGALERGVVLCPTIARAEGGLMFSGGLLPPRQLVRYALLYWDRLNFVENNVVGYADPERDLLIQAGVANKMRLEMYGQITFDVFMGAHIAALRELNAKEPGQWSLGQQSERLVIPAEQLEQKHLVEIALNSVLPNPPADANLETILELRTARRDELRALRLAVDEVYLEVMRSGDLPTAQSAAIRRLSTAVSDVRKVVEKTWLERLVSELKFEFQPSRTFKDASLGAAAAALALPGLESVAAGVGAAAGAAASLFKFEAKQGAAIKGLPERSTAFAYLYHIEKALPGTLPPA